MSKNLSAASIAQFDSFTKHDYQGQGVLRPTVRLKSGIVGATHRFPKMGKGVATPRLGQTDVIPMNIGHGNATVTLSDWNAPEYTDLFDQAKTNVQEKKELATVISGAVTRREDQLIIDALDAAATTKVVAKSVGGVDTNMNTAKAREAKRLMDVGGVPKTERIMLIHSNSLHGMLGETDATSSDFAVVKTLVQGEIDTWLGFKWVDLEDRDEGGLALAASTRTNFAYHKWAVGLGVGIDHRTEVNYIPEKTSWLCNGLFSAGATAIDASGIVEVSTHDVF